MVKLDEMRAEFNASEERLRAQGRSNSWARAMLACAMSSTEMTASLLPTIEEKVMDAGSATAADKVRSVMLTLDLAKAQMGSIVEDLIVLETEDWKLLELGVKTMGDSYRSLVSELRRAERDRDVERGRADAAERELSGLRSTLDVGRESSDS